MKNSKYVKKISTNFPSSHCFGFCHNHSNLRERKFFIFSGYYAEPNEVYGKRPWVHHYSPNTFEDGQLNEKFEVLLRLPSEIPPRDSSSLIYRQKNNSIVAFGGDLVCGFPSTDLIEVNVENGKWKLLKFSNCPIAVFAHSALYIKRLDEMIIFGGGKENLSQYLYQTEKDYTNDLYICDFQNEKWSGKIQVKNDEKPPVRDFHSMNFINKYENEFIVMGGKRVDHYYNDVWLYSIKGKKWKEIKCKGKIPVGRHSHGNVVYKDRLFICGGKIAHYTYINDFFELDLNTFVWKEYSFNGEIIPKIQGNRFGLIEDNDKAIKIISFGGCTCVNEKYVSLSCIYLITLDDNIFKINNSSFYDCTIVTKEY